MLQSHYESYARDLYKDIEIFFQSNYPDFKISVARFDWSPTRNSSKGGLFRDGYGIDIAMSFFLNYHQVPHRIYEYSSFDRDPTIGGFYTHNALDSLKMTICHEMAHAFQHFLYSQKVDRCKPHGKLFKKIYAELREKFVNPYLPNQKLAKQDYENYLNQIKKEEFSFVL